MENKVCVFSEFVHGKIGKRAGSKAIELTVAPFELTKR